MHILLGSVFHVSDYYGGNEHYIHYLGVELVARGHQVTYITGKVGKTSRIPYTLIPTKLWHIGKHPVPSWQWHHQLNNLCPDIAHFSGSGFPLVSAGLHLRYLKRIPTILTFQAPTRPKNPFIKIPALIEKHLTPTAFSAVITTGPQNQSLLQDQWPHHQIKMIPMMLADHFFLQQPSQSVARRQTGLPKNRKIVLFVGQLDANHYYKGFDVLIEAARQLSDDYLIYAIGYCDPQTGFPDLVKQYGLTNRITFAGFLDNTKLSSYFNSADAFVLPSTSDSEGFGLVLLEAMACGLPTITTTAIGSASWFAQHRVCTLIPPHDPTALALAIKKAVNNPDKSQLLRASKFVKNFTSKKMAEQTLQLYESLITTVR